MIAVLTAGDIAASGVGERAVTSRNALHSITCRLAGDSTIHRPDRVDRYKKSGSYWLDRDRVRTDFVAEQGPYAQMRQVNCKNCERPGMGIHLIEKPHLAVSTFKLDDKGVSRLNYAFDIRVAGYQPEDLLIVGRQPLVALSGSELGGTAAVTPTDLDGRPHLLVSRTTRNGWMVRNWIDPGRGHTVVRVELVQPGGPGRPPEAEIVCRSTLVEDNGHWFPSQIVTDIKTDGQPYFFERWEFRDVRLNRPVPPETFTLAGIKVKDGSYISDHTAAKKSGVWKDGRLTPYKPPAKKAEPVDPPPVPVDARRPVNLWLMAGCLASAAAALTLVVWRVRGRS